MQQRQASPHTIASFRDTFRLLVQYALRELRKAPAALDIGDLDNGLPRGLPDPSRDRAGQRRPQPQHPLGCDPLLLRLRRGAGAPACSSGAACAGDACQAPPPPPRGLPRPRRDRGSAESPGHADAGRAPRPHAVARGRAVQNHIISAAGPCFFSNCSDAQTAGNPNNQRIRLPWIRRLRSRFRRGKVSTGT